MTDYNRGYFKALRDIKGIIEITQFNCPCPNTDENPKRKYKYKHLFSKRTIVALLQFLIENREDFIKYGSEYTFFMYVDEKGHMQYKKINID